MTLELNLPKLSQAEIISYFPKVDVSLDVGPKHERSKEWVVYNTSDIGLPVMATMVDNVSFKCVRSALAYSDQERKELQDFIETSGLEGALETHVLNKYPLAYHPDSPDNPLFLLERRLNLGTVFMTLSDTLYVEENFSTKKLLFARKSSLELMEILPSGDITTLVFHVNSRGRINSLSNTNTERESFNFRSTDLAATDWCFVHYNKDTGKTNPISIKDALGPYPF